MVLPWPDGIRGELFKTAYVDVELLDGRRRRDYILLPVLHQLLSAAFEVKEVPAVWCTAYVSAVFKKGDASDLDNYRPIAVGAVLGKLFSMLVDARLSSYSEACGYRAEGQAGFRLNHRTSDHVFVLQHLVDRCHLQPRQRLYVCFVDFRKAYDLIRRDLLMERLAAIGVSGNMLHAILQMYWHAPMQPKLRNQVASPFDSTRGVKQGDPLSPLLFGLFIDQLEHWLAVHVPAAGVQLGPTLLQLLLYADDLALVASSPAALQQLLDSLAGFCQQYAMEVNVRKTEVVEFRRPRTRPTDWQWTFAGHVLPVSQQFRYLGVVFHATKGMTAAVDVLRDAALRAMWGMLSRAKALGIHCLAVLCRLFHTLVVPIMTYCSEVWGPLLLSRGGALGSVHTNVLQQVQLLFLRRLGGLRKSTPAALLFREFGARPLSRDWLRAMVQLWNRVTTLPADHVMRRTMVDNWSLHLSAHPKVVLWSDGFASALAALGFPPTSFMAMSATGCWVMSHLDMDQVLAAFDEWCDGAWGHLPRDPRGSSSEHILYATYARWFTRPAAVDQVALLHSPADVPRYVTFSGLVCSLFVCCGGLDDAGRVNRGVLDPCDVRVFMSQHPRRVAAFIHECFAWRAQEVRLPPYVPAAYMLDTFSSSVSELMVVDDDDVEIHS
eukprot:gene15185-biopygen2136